MGVGAGLYMYDVVVEKFTLAISSHDEFLLITCVCVCLRISVSLKKTFELNDI